MCQELQSRFDVSEFSVLRFQLLLLRFDLLVLLLHLIQEHGRQHMV